MAYPHVCSQHTVCIINLSRKNYKWFYNPINLLLYHPFLYAGYPFFLEWPFSFLIQLTSLGPENFQGLLHVQPWRFLSPTPMWFRGASFLFTVFNALFCNFHFVCLSHSSFCDSSRKMTCLIWSYMLNMECKDYLRIQTHQMLVEQINDHYGTLITGTQRHLKFDYLYVKQNSSFFRQTCMPSVIFNRL